MSRVSISSSFSAARAASSTCADLLASECPFFVRFPFMRRCLSGADDASDLFARFRFCLWPGVNDQDCYAVDPSDRGPARFFRMRVRPRGGKRLLEHACRQRKAEAMFAPVGAFLRRVLSPAHRSSRVATKL